MEAMASELPLVATRGGSARVVDGEPGLFVGPERNRYGPIVGWARICQTIADDTRDDRVIASAPR
jgi:hypothetical protein